MPVVYHKKLTYDYYKELISRWNANKSSELKAIYHFSS